MLLAAVPIALLADAAAAQQRDEPQTIVVTGERVKRSLKDTAASVAVFDRRDLDRLAAPDRVQDLLALVPNIFVPSSRDTPTIRGQNSAGVLAGLPAFLGGARPRTVVQIDGRTVTFNEFAFSPEGLWDVDHVEIFRSPQTTTQGVNSIAGAIFIHTADPTYRFEGRARAIVGELGRRQLSAALSLPLADDQLALRVSGDVYRAHAATRLSGPIAGVDLNRDRYWTGRAKLLAEPHAVPGLRVLVTYAHNDTEAPQSVIAKRPYRERRDPAYVFGYFKVNVDSVTATVTYPFTATLESRTTLSWGDARFRRFAPHGFGQTQIQGRDASVESVLQWTPAAAIEAVGGVSYLGTDLNQLIDLSVTPLGIGTFEDKQRSRALFGEVTVRPVPRLSLTGGARVQSDRKDRFGVLHTVPVLPLDYDRTVTALLPKLSAAYDLGRDVRVGALVQRAYNPGGVTLDPSRAGEVRFDPEYLWDYEAFVRGSLLGGALSVTGNLFYNSIRNAQRTQDLCLPTPTGCVGLSEVGNAPRAHSYGAEIEIDWRASSRLRLRTAIGLLATRITRTILAADPILGKQFGNAPTFTGTAAAEWRPLPGLTIDGQVRHNSAYFNDDRETRELRIPGSTTLDVRVSLERGRWTLFGYARNLLDEFHVTGYGGPPQDPNADGFVNDPRQLGVGAEARF